MNNVINLSSISQLRPSSALDKCGIWMRVDAHRIIKPLWIEALRCCGHCHEVYIASFSRKVDELVSKVADPSVGQAIIDAARKEDYFTTDEVRQMQQECLDQGRCIHGLDPDCCPVGCGDLCRPHGRMECSECYPEVCCDV